MKKYILTVIILFITLGFYGSNEKKIFFITYQNANVFLKTSAFSSIIYSISFGQAIEVLSIDNKWVKVISEKEKIVGFIHVDALVNSKTFRRQEKVIKKRKIKDGKNVTMIKFTEEETVGAAAKGFKEKHSSPSSSTTKGFNKIIEKKYNKKIKGMRYDLVDLIEQRGKKYTSPKLYSKWRKKGKLGEYSPFYRGLESK